jgi:hypothetical protein
MIGQEKGDLLYTDHCLIEVTTWAGSTALYLSNKTRRGFDRMVLDL